MQRRQHVWCVQCAREVCIEGAGQGRLTQGSALVSYIRPARSTSPPCPVLPCTAASTGSLTSLPSCWCQWKVPTGVWVDEGEKDKEVAVFIPPTPSRLGWGKVTSFSSQSQSRVKQPSARSIGLTSFFSGCCSWAYRPGVHSSWPL